MKISKSWIKENWMYFTPFVSLVNRPYHWIKKDEDVWDEIDRNLMCAAGNIALCDTMQVAMIVFLIVGSTQ